LNFFSTSESSTNLLFAEVGCVTFSTLTVFLSLFGISKLIDNHKHTISKTMITDIFFQVNINFANVSPVSLSAPSFVSLAPTFLDVAPVLGVSALCAGKSALFSNSIGGYWRVSKCNTQDWSRFFDNHQPHTLHPNTRTTGRCPKLFFFLMLRRQPRSTQYLFTPKRKNILTLQKWTQTKLKLTR